jgi:hypothetical protein
MRFVGHLLGIAPPAWIADIVALRSCRKMKKKED